MGREGKEGSKRKGDDVPQPPHSNMSRYDVHIYLCAQTESANVIHFLFPIYRTAWPASQTSLQLDFELRTKRYTF